ncbi:MAG TPA: hypothetical protein VHE81_17600 [Lacipirellulaceae bacterium]|nr:hypothetical protein [Lacipirellulaceae bacterium]
MRSVPPHFGQTGPFGGGLVMEEGMLRAAPGSIVGIIEYDGPPG